MTVNKIAQSSKLASLFAIVMTFLSSEGMAQSASLATLSCPGFFQSVKVKCDSRGFFYDQRSNECVFLYSVPAAVESLNRLCGYPCIGKVTSPEELNRARPSEYFSLFNECGEVRQAGRCPADGKIPAREAHYQVSCYVATSKTVLAPFDEDA